MPVITTDMSNPQRFCQVFDEVEAAHRRCISLTVLGDSNPVVRETQNALALKTFKNAAELFNRLDQTGALDVETGLCKKAKAMLDDSERRLNLLTPKSAPTPSIQAPEENKKPQNPISEQFEYQPPVMKSDTSNKFLLFIRSFLSAGLQFLMNLLEFLKNIF